MTFEEVIHLDYLTLFRRNNGELFSLLFLNSDIWGFFSKCTCSVESKYLLSQQKEISRKCEQINSVAFGMKLVKI